MQTLTVSPIEEGTLVISYAFTDALDAEATVKTALWTLTDLSGNIINSRNNVSISTPGNSGNIVLSGDDLEIGTTGLTREFLLEGTYDSTYGSDLPFKSVCRFTIENVIAVPDIT